MTARKMERSGDRLYLKHDKGRKLLPLPLPYNPQEFTLPGNSKELIPGLMWAVYDETTRTGAIWRALPQPGWTLAQPCTRNEFFGEMCDLAIELNFEQQN